MSTYRERMDQAADKVAKLPKWAQDYVDDLARRAEQAEAQLAEIKQGPADSNVFRVWGLRDDDQALGKDCEIRYQLSPYDSIAVRPDRRGMRCIDIQGDKSIYIEPWAANSVRIWLREEMKGAGR